MAQQCDHSQRVSVSDLVGFQGLFRKIVNFVLSSQEKLFDLTASPGQLDFSLYIMFTLIPSHSSTSRENVTTLFQAPALQVPDV